MVELKGVITFSVGRYAAVALSLLASCGLSEPEKRSSTAISESVLRNIRNANLEKLNSDLKELRDTYEPIPSGSDGSGHIACLSQTVIFADHIGRGGRWARQWLTAPTEAAARTLTNNPKWLAQIYSRSGEGECSDPTLAALRRSARETFDQIKRSVDQSYPNLAKKIRLERTEAAAREMADRKKRIKLCELNDGEQQRIFESFIRLEDKFGKNNEGHQSLIASSQGVSSECVRKVMIESLDSGRIPPEPY